MIEKITSERKLRERKEKMKDAKFISIFVLLLILIALLIFTLWCVVLPELAKDAFGIQRKRREPPLWMEQMMEQSNNKSLQRSSENILLTALGRLEISGPEDVMTYITVDSPCKQLKPHIGTFERHRKDVPDKKLFVRLFNAIKKFYSMYCGRDERYQKLFTKSQDELQNLHENFEDCKGAPDWYENMNATLRCEDAHIIMNCFVDTLRMEIGDGAANAWQCIFKSVVNEAMIQPCNFANNIADDVSRSRSGWMLLWMILFATFIVVAGVIYGLIKYMKK